MLLAPLSEYYGRNPIYVWSWFILVIFQIPLALAPNIDIPGLGPAQGYLAGVADQAISLLD